MTTPRILRRAIPQLTATLAAAALLAALPLGARLSEGRLSLHDSIALAAQGADDAPGDDRGGDRPGKKAHKDKDTSGGEKHGKKRKGHKPAPPPSDGPVTAIKIERSTAGIEVSYSDGTREEIENGRYERKNAAGRTVEQRPATQADIDRLAAL